MAALLLFFSAEGKEIVILAQRRSLQNTRESGWKPVGWNGRSFLLIYVHEILFGCPNAVRGNAKFRRIPNTLSTASSSKSVMIPKSKKVPQMVLRSLTNALGADDQPKSRKQNSCLHTKTRDSVCTENQVKPSCNEILFQRERATNPLPMLEKGASNRYAWL